MTKVRMTSVFAAVLFAVSACNSGGDAKELIAPEADIATVAVTAPATSLAPGDATQLTASAMTAGRQVVSGAQFAWLSEAPEVAKVDQAGRVTAVSSGKSSIVATAGSVRGAVTITVRTTTGLQQGGSR